MTVNDSKERKDQLKKKDEIITDKKKKGEKKH
jgi:hypothetical protein